MSSKTVYAVILTTLVIGGFVAAQGPARERLSAPPPNANTVTSATSPLVDTAGVLSVNCASAIGSGAVCRAGTTGPLTLDAGVTLTLGAMSAPAFLINADSNVASITGVNGGYLNFFSSVGATFGWSTNTLILDGTNSTFSNNVKAPSVAFTGAAVSLTSTAPTITSACTSPTVTHGGAISFQVDVGGTCTGVTTIVLGLPTATNGWYCTGYNKTTATMTLEQTADTTASATMVNTAKSNGAATDFVDGADLVIGCTGR